jgi:hypothetical protein
MALKSNLEIFRFSYPDNITKILRTSTLLLWRIYVAGSNNTYLGLHVECPLFLSDINLILTFSADFHRSLQCQMSWTSVGLEPRWYMTTDKQI